jgi:hypothetical protein
MPKTSSQRSTIRADLASALKVDSLKTGNIQAAAIWSTQLRFRITLSVNRQPELIRTLNIEPPADVRLLTMRIICLLYMTVISTMVGSSPYSETSKLLTAII